MTLHRALSAAALLLVLLAPVGARADGGQVLLHQHAGPFTITVFASPQPVSAGEADLSALVQDGSEKVIADATISLLLVGPDGHSYKVPLDRQSGVVRAGAFRFAQTGRWRLTVVAQRGAEQSEASAEFDVLPSHSRGWIVWTFVLLPLACIALFAWRESSRPRETGLK